METGQSTNRFKCMYLNGNFLHSLRRWSLLMPRPAPLPVQRNQQPAHRPFTTTTYNFVTVSVLCCNSFGGIVVYIQCTVYVWYLLQ